MVAGAGDGVAPTSSGAARVQGANALQTHSASDSSRGGDPGGVAAANRHEDASETGAKRDDDEFDAEAALALLRELEL